MCRSLPRPETMVSLITVMGGCNDVVAVLAAVLLGDQVFTRHLQSLTAEGEGL